MELSHGQILHEAGEPIRHIHFAGEGVISQLALMEGGQEIEVGLIDREGLVGFSVAMVAEITNIESMVQVPGWALRMSADALRAKMERGGLLPALSCASCSPCSSRPPRWRPGTSGTRWMSGWHAGS